MNDFPHGVLEMMFLPNGLFPLKLEGLGMSMAREMRNEIVWPIFKNNDKGFFNL